MKHLQEQVIHSKDGHLQIEEKVTKNITYNATWVMNWVQMNSAPVIKATDKTIEVGYIFDPKADVTATDEEDGDITDKIEILPMK